MVFTTCVFLKATSLLNLGEFFTDASNEKLISEELSLLKEVALIERSLLASNLMQKYQHVSKDILNKLLPRGQNIPYSPPGLRRHWTAHPGTEHDEQLGFPSLRPGRPVL